MRYLTVPLFLALLFIYQVPVTNAAMIATISDRVSNESSNTNADHLITFTTTTTGITSGQTVIITFPDGTANGFVGQAGIDYTDVDVTDDGVDVTLAATPSGATWGAAFSGANLNVLTLTNGTTAVAAGSVVTIEIGLNATSGDRQIRNPNTTGSFRVPITGTFLGTETAQYAIPIANPDDTIAVDGTIGVSITFALSNNSCALGTLTTSGVGSCGPYTYTVGTTAGGGYTVYIQDVGDGTSNPGLWKGAAPTYRIPTTTSTLAGGTEGYGLNAQINTGTQTILGNYNQPNGNNVGAFARTPTQLSTFATPTPANQITNFYIKAAIAAGTAAGTYGDTITFTATGNF